MSIHTDRTYLTQMSNINRNNIVIIRNMISNSILQDSTNKINTSSRTLIETTNHGWYQLSIFSKFDVSSLTASDRKLIQSQLKSFNSFLEIIPTIISTERYDSPGSIVCS